MELKKNIAVLMGGYGSEYKISIKSGATVVAELDKTVYDVYAVHILKDKWICRFEEEEFHIDKRDFSVMLPFGQVYFDACYNTIHGAPGENGQIQAYLDTIGLPQTASNFYQSALTFNKKDTLSVLRAYDIPMASSIYISKKDAVSPEDVANLLHKKNMNYPVFVKPNQSGSSYGISKVYKESDIANALQLAFAEDDCILIESFLDGVEVSVGVYRDAHDNVEVLPVCQIIPDGDFFDLNAKYSGKSQEIVPAQIAPSMTTAVKQLTARIYTILELSGICRIDFIFHNQTPHFIEVNTNPGLSLESIIPKQFKALGIPLSQIFGMLIETAIHKAEKKKV